MSRLCHSRAAAFHVAPLVALLALTAPALASDSTLALPPVKVSGYAQIDYRRSAGDFPPGSPHHELAIRRARLALSGRAHERVALQVVFAGDRPTSTSPVAVLDAFGDVDLSHAWKLRVGQFKYEFDIEAREADERTVMIDRSFATYLVAGSLRNRSTPSAPASSSRDRGLSLLGTVASGPTALEVAAGVYQGNGRAPDDDSEVAYTLRARARSHGVTLNAGWRACPDTASDAGMAAGRVVDTGWTAGLEVATRSNRLRGEFYQRDRTRGGEDLGGGYVLDVLRVHPAIDVFGRAQVVSLPDRRIDATLGDAPRVTAYDVGGRFYFMRNGSRIDTWVAVSYMVRRSRGAIEPDWFTSLNDGLGTPLSAAGQLGDVLAVRFQVAL